MSADDVAATIGRARAAAQEVEYWTQQRVDHLVAAVGWQCYREDNVRAMSEFAYTSTGLGDPVQMHAMHRRRVIGLLRDLHGVTTIGLVDDQPALGISRLAKPVGVIAATCPTTAACQTAVSIVLPMLKTRNAVILLPSPRGQQAVTFAVGFMRRALAEVDAPLDLIQCPATISKESTVAIMASADLVVATGGKNALKRAYSTGTPAIGAGVGNATVVVDETADIRDAAEKIARGASFNNGTSCSSESNVLVEASVLPAFITELERAGVHVCEPAEVERLRSVLWPDGKRLDRNAIGRSAAKLAADAGVAVTGDGVNALAAAVTSVDLTDPLWGEKLSPVFTIASYLRFEDAIEDAQRILAGAGRGHSCAIHSRNDDRIAAFAATIRSARVLVNQSVALGNSGNYDNGLPFSPTVACGSWGGCGQSENITWRNYLNYTTVSRPIDPVLPSEDVIFGSLRDFD